jgi:hypothetical protein
VYGVSGRIFHAARAGRLLPREIAQYCVHTVAERATADIIVFWLAKPIATVPRSKDWTLGMRPNMVLTLKIFNPSLILALPASLISFALGRVGKVILEWKLHPNVVCVGFEPDTVGWRFLRRAELGGRPHAFIVSFCAGDWLKTVTVDA